METLVAEYVQELDETRRSMVERLHRLIRAGAADLDLRRWAYGGPMLGYGTYPYRNASGGAGEWFALGIAARARHVSFFSNALRDGTYLLERYAERLPGVKILRSCINLTRPEQIDDGVIAEIVAETRLFFADRFGPPDLAGAGTE